MIEFISRKFLTILLFLTLIIPGVTLAMETDTFEGGSGLLNNRPNWTADATYTITSGEVINTGTVTWGELAIFAPGTVTNPTTAKIKYSAENADQTGIGASGILMMMNATTTSASGYFVRVTGGNIYLYFVASGVLQTSPIATTAFTGKNPGPGDEVSVVWGNLGYYYFKVYINGTYVGVVKHQSPSHAPSTYYSGFMQYSGAGTSYANSHVEDFGVDRDDTPPAKITNLASGTLTEASVTLTWTAPGDDGSTGTASGYDIRYSTANIATDNDFNNATQVSGEPAPKPAGSSEQFEVTGLSPETGYYFAIKAYDDGSNYSPLSNVLFATTLAPPGDWITVVDKFDRIGPGLGSNWDADPGYSLENEELHFSGTGWGHMAVFKPSMNTHSVSFKWSAISNPAGRDAGGVCIVTDTTRTADGYLIIRKSSKNNAQLYKIEDGNVLGDVDSESSPKLAAPGAGDSITVIPDIRADKSVFEIYINGNYDCYLVHEGAGRWTFENGLYAGIMLYGDASRNHNLDNFTVQVPKGEASLLKKYFNPFDNYNNCAEKGIKYPDSLAVQVLDQYKNPYSGALVNFTVTSGSATLSTDYANFDGKIWYEAEDGNVVAPMQVFDDTRAAGGKYVESTGANGYGHVDFNIYIPVAGSYRLWVRKLALDGNKSSFYVSLDAGTEDKWESEITSNFTWMTKDPIFYNVAKGLHTLRIRNRESGFKLDKILLTNNGSVRPENENGGKGYPTTRFSNITNARGIASTFVTVGTDQHPYQSVFVQGSADGLSGSPVPFEVPLCTPPAALMVKESGDNQNGYGAGTQLPQPLVVKLTDAEAYPAPNQLVTFAVTRGGGKFSNGQATELVKTNGEGKAITYWTLGFADETQEVRVTAQVTTGSPQLFAAANVTGIPRNIMLFSGNEQGGKAGSTLPNPLQVKVTDRNNAPVNNYEVSFSIVSGGGSLNTYKPKTNSSGIAEVTWTLGGTVGTQRCKAEASGLTGSPVEFTASAVEGDPEKLIEISGNGQTGPIGERLENPYIIQVTDKNGNPIPGHQVRFEVTAGGGNINGLVSEDRSTDLNGKASVYHTMGAQEGSTNTVKVTANGNTGSPLTGSPIYFNATSTTGRASILHKISGDNQNGPVTLQLGNPIKIKVTDPFGNPRGGHVVNFAVLSGNGHLGNLVSQRTTSTDAGGFAQVDWYLGTIAGRQELQVTSNRNTGVPLDNSPMIFVATATPGNPKSLVKIDSSDYQGGKAGQQLPKPLQAKVLDQYSNGVSNHPVIFEVKSGGGNVEGGMTKTARTDSAGIARVVYTLGTEPGVDNNKIEARSSYNNNPLTGSPVTFTASTGDGDPTSLFLVRGNNQTGIVNSPLPDSFIVQVTDKYKNPIQDHLVTFTVRLGEGSIASATSLTVPTDPNGKCGVVLTLGTKAGQNNNTVEATAGANLVPASITFYASAGPGPAHAMAIVGGDGQEGGVGLPLPAPLEVVVTDEFGNTIRNHFVTFKAVEPIDGPGKVDGQVQVEKMTDAIGRASVIFTLGTKPGVLNHKVEARSTRNGNPIIGSPLLFRASATPGEPDQLVKVSGDSLKGVVGNPLDDWFRVKVTDMVGNAIPNHPVIFEVIRGGGFLGADNAKIDTIVTAANGIAQTWLTLGNTSGILNNVVEVRGYRIGVTGPMLRGSGLKFYATAYPSLAQKLVYVAGTKQSGVVGTLLARSFDVMATDGGGNPVPGHAVTFQVIKGGTLDGDSLKQKTVMTGPNGIASVTLKLGTVAGDSNSVKAWSTDGFKELTGSPLIFSALPNADLPDPNMSSMIARPDTLPADGSTEGFIHVYLKDKFKNPVPGKTISLIDSTGITSLEQPLGKTDKNGLLTGYIKSIRAGKYKIYTFDLSDQYILNCRAVVVFTPLGAQKIEPYGGQGQSGNLGTVLASPLQVIVVDKGANPIPEYPVTFVAISGGGQIVDPQPAYTDSLGVASARFRLGLQKGTNVIEARAPGLNGNPVLFSVVAKEGIPHAIQKVGGDNQSGPAGTILPQPLAIKITDIDRSPVAGIKIKFVPALGGGSVDPDTISTDLNGIASTYATLGGAIGDNLFGSEVMNKPAIHVIFNAIATVGEKDRLVKESGDRQEGMVGFQLPLPLSVKVTDKFGNAVANVPVNFRVLSGGAQISGSTQITSNSRGIASVAVTLGNTVGVNTVEASATALKNSPIIFTLIGRAGPGAVMLEYSGNHQRMSRNRETNYPICVLVKDQYGNPAENTLVSFFVSQGSGQIIGNQSVYSDEYGLACARWRLGPNTGTNQANAYASHLRPTEVIFTAEAVFNEFPIVNCPQFETVMEGGTLQFEVTATDQDDPNDKIIYGARGLHQLEGAVFDSTSVPHRFSWTPPRKSSGDYTIEFTATDQKGDMTIGRTVVTVKSSNRTPVILSYSPSNPVRLAFDASKVFSVSASDPDGDPLTYRWLSGNQELPMKSSYANIYGRDLGIGQHQLSVEVSDGETVIIPPLWIVDVSLTAVELENFSALAVEYRGVVLDWSTTREVDNAGFNILRSQAKDGSYVKVNSTLISYRQDGKYSFIDKDVKAGNTYYYKLEDIDLVGNSTMHQAISVIVPIPKKFGLSQNYPNPFNPTTHIRFTVPELTKVSIVIFNIMGQKVKTLVDDKLEPGFHELTWDGKDDNGLRAGSGIYYYRMVADNFVDVKKMAFLK